MKLTMLLADAAQVAEGKLYILGGGWSMTGPSEVPSAIAIKIEVPWDQANRQHHFVLELFDGDCQSVKMGNDAVKIQGQFETGRPAGLAPGTHRPSEPGARALCVALFRRRRIPR